MVFLTVFDSNNIRFLIPFDGFLIPLDGHLMIFFVSKKTNSSKNTKKTEKKKRISSISQVRNTTFHKVRLWR